MTTTTMVMRMIMVTTAMAWAGVRGLRWRKIPMRKRKALAVHKAVPGPSGRPRWTVMKS